MLPSQKSFGNTWVLASSFIAAGLSVLPGVLHSSLIIDQKYLQSIPTHLFATGGFFYISGAILYAKKWPESRYPIVFDIIGNSHNIFHVNCIFGSLFTFWGSIKMFHER
jgi:adiponectin receptor